MPRHLTNKSNVSLALAAWLATDDYDYNPDPYTISATTFLRPIRATALHFNNLDRDTVNDVTDFIASRLGNAIHDSIERSWTKASIHQTLNDLGVPMTIQSKIVINPDSLEPGQIPIYIEKRRTKKLGKYTISGKPDLIMAGIVEDIKTTAVFNYISGSNTDKYRMQTSIYRWIMPDWITEDFLNIHYVFTDWSKIQSYRDKNYPPSRLVSKSYALYSEQETEAFLSNYLQQLDRYRGKPQNELPQCTPEELWQKPTIYKYYKNPSNKTRATKNSENYSELQELFIKDGSVGEIVTHPGQVKRCEYCNVVDICDQAKTLQAHGLLII